MESKDGQNNDNSQDKDNSTQALFNQWIEKGALQPIASAIQKGYRPTKEQLNLAFKQGYELKYTKPGFFPGLIALLAKYKVPFDVDTPIPIKTDDPNFQEFYLIDYFVDEKKPEIVKLLCNLGADPDVLRRRGPRHSSDNLLIYALTRCDIGAMAQTFNYGQYDIIEVLLKFAPFDFSLDVGHQTPLFLSFMRRCKAQSLIDLMVTELKKEDIVNPKINLKTRQDKTEYINSIFYFSDFKTLQKIIEIGGEEFVQQFGDILIVSMVNLAMPPDEIASSINLMLRYGTPMHLQDPEGFLSKLNSAIQKNKNITPEMIEEISLRKKIENENIRNKDREYWEARDNEKFSPYKPIFFDEEFIGNTNRYLKHKLAYNVISARELERGLMMALRKKDNKNIDAAVLLIAYGANPLHIPGLENTPLQIFIETKENFEKIRKMKGDPHPLKYAYELISELARTGDVNRLRLMLEVDDFPLYDPSTIAALKIAQDIAEKNNQLNAAEFLKQTLGRIQDVLNIKEEGKKKRENTEKDIQQALRGRLLLAIKNKNVKKIEEIVQMGADPSFLGLCLEPGSRMEALDNTEKLEGSSVNGVSPLHFVCMYPNEKSVEIFKLLLDLGANFHAANDFAIARFNKSLYDLIPTSGKEDLGQFVLERANKIPKEKTHSDKYFQQQWAIKRKKLPPLSTLERYKSFDWKGVEEEADIAFLRNETAKAIRGEPNDFEKDSEDIKKDIKGVIEHFFLLYDSQRKRADEFLEHKNKVEKEYREDLRSRDLDFNGYQVFLNDNIKLRSLMHSRHIGPDIIPSLNFLFRLVFETNSKDYFKTFMESKSFVPDLDTAQYALYCILKNDPAFAPEFINYCLNIPIPIDLNEKSVYEFVDASGNITRETLSPMDIALKHNIEPLKDLLKVISPSSPKNNL